MPEPTDTPKPRGGLYDPAPKEPITSVEVVSVLLSLFWLGGSVVLFLFLEPGEILGGPSGALQFVLTLLVVFLPVAMIWVAATAARSSRVMREESRRLQAAIDAIRKAYVAQNQTQNRQAVSEPSVNRKLDEIATAQRKTQTALATFSSTRPITPVQRISHPATRTAEDDAQVDLPLGTTSEDIAPPLERSDFIRALNFPETAEDKAGFAALRKALKDRTTARLIQAAQDVLTLMSQDGIYMDDLRPDMARPEVWRRFATGERGRAIASLGGIRDRSSLALTASRMKSDPIFRDAGHHFLRRFDRMVSEFCETATDTEISEMSDTRTARAFMLLGRVAGTFD